jgi:hypothetical protein
MQIRLAVLAALVCGASFGCATPAEDSKAPAAADAASQPRQTGSYRTGSRLPSYEDDTGASTTSNVSKDDYADEARRTISPTMGR